MMKFKLMSLALCGLLLIPLITSGSLSAQIEIPKIPEDVSLDLLLEFKSTGRLRVKADYSGPNPFLYTHAYVQQPVVIGPSYAASSVFRSPALPVSWDISVELSSPREGTLKIAATGWVILPLTAEQKQMVALTVAGYKAAPELIEREILRFLRHRFRQITDLDITELNWDNAASKLTFGLTLTAEDPAVGAELLRELPVSIHTTGSGTIPTFPIRAPADPEGLTLGITFKFVGQLTVAELRADFTGLASTIETDWEFDLLPFSETEVVTLIENTIVVDFGKMRAFWPPRVTIPPVTAHEKVRFTLKVPSGATVENLPPGYTQVGSTYTWTGTPAASALLALITGAAGTRISYWVGPGTVTITGIQARVGQEVQVIDPYIKKVKIEGARIFIVELEEAQSVRELRITSLGPMDELRFVRSPRRLLEKPPEIPDPPTERGIVYEYLEMETGAPEQIESVVIEFKVPKLWMRVKNIDRTTVRLLRYQDGRWTELETREVGEDDNNVYFSAETSRFSVFAIAAQLPVPAAIELPLWIVIVAALALTVVLAVAVRRYGRGRGRSY